MGIMQTGDSKVVYAGMMLSTRRPFHPVQVPAKLPTKPLCTPGYQYEHKQHDGNTDITAGPQQ